MKFKKIKTGSTIVGVSHPSIDKVNSILVSVFLNLDKHNNNYILHITKTDLFETNSIPYDDDIINDDNWYEVSSNFLQLIKNIFIDKKIRCDEMPFGDYLIEKDGVIYYYNFENKTASFIDIGNNFKLEYKASKTWTKIS